MSTPIDENGSTVDGRKDAATARTELPTPADPARYQVRREVAAGGMGRIFEAIDLQNQRPVAIKSALSTDEGSVRRLRREARITARLQHPGIVTLYDTGQWTSGDPFFVMRFVAGRSLRTVIDETKSSKERLALLPHLIAVTEALAYAHREQVIHRDLKPSNVLVGAFGETVVIDWGLAKPLSEAEDDDRDAPMLPDPKDRQITVAGTALGTPSYMAPEQARGEAVDERTDVYALGALLYHAFAGEPPYAHASPAEIVDRVRNASPQPLEELVPDLPQDLLAIVRKAMARDPRDRYASAQSMAEDLKRFSTGQLVSVYSYTLLALLQRWVARHRAAVAVAAVLLVVLAVGTIVSVQQILHERDRADESSRVAQAERATALTQRDAAEQLVEFMIGELKDRLEPLGKLEMLAGVGDKVESYYRALGETSAAPASILRRRARALEALAEVESMRHEGSSATTLYASSLALYQRIVDLEPTSAAKGDLLEERLRSAKFETAQTGANALEHAKAVRDDAAALLVAEPANPRWMALSVDADQLLAKQHRARGELDDALVDAREGLNVALALSKAEPNEDRSARLLGAAYQSLGRLEYAKGNFDAPSLQESVRVLGSLQAKKPDDPRAAMELSQSYLYAALAQRNGGRLDDAIASMHRCRELRQSLTDRDPTNVEWKRALAESYDTLCSVEQRAGRVEESIADCRKSVALAQDVVARDPDAQQAADSLLLAYERLAWVFCERSRFREAIEPFQAAVAIAEKFAARAPNDRDWQNRVVESRGLLAETFFRMGRVDEAIENYSAVAAILDKLDAKTVGPAERRTILATRGLLGTLEYERGRKLEGLKLLDSAIETLLAMPEIPVDEEDLLFKLADACARLAQAIAAGDFQSAEAASRVEQAIARLEPLRVPKNSPDKRLALLKIARRALAQPLR